MNTEEIIRSQSSRSKVILEECLKHLDDSVRTVWGKMKFVDGYFLAALELGEMKLARDLFDDTLDMILASIKEEEEFPRLKFHLADFALQPLFLAYHKYQDADLDWDRLRELACRLKPHYGDLSENHNFLHLTIRHVMAAFWPEATLSDGKIVGEHAQEEVGELIKWMDDYLTGGSGEWGSDIYVNVNLMALINLVTLSKNPEVKAKAEVTLNAFALDQALDAKFGAPVGAAKRIYAIYRMDTRESPSRPLHHIWFGTGEGPVWNSNFIGAPVMAACLDYRPDPRIIALAAEATPHETYAWHRNGLFTWGPFGRLDTDPPIDNELGRYTKRGNHYVLGSMIASPGRARYSEQVFQITLGERAMVFANHPAAYVDGDPDTRINPEKPDLFERYLEERLPETQTERRDQPAYWVYGNMLPGAMNHADKRPGWWHGNQDGPRSFGRKDWTVQLWKINEIANVDFAHVYLPAKEFDEIIEDGKWIAFRKGSGAGVICCSSDYQKTDKGIWKDLEVCIPGPKAGLYAAAGDLEAGQSLSSFLESHQARKVTFEMDSFACLLNEEGAEVRVNWLDGAQRISQGSTEDLAIAGDRLETPFGKLDHTKPLRHIDEFFNAVS